MTIPDDICISECKPDFHQLVPNLVVVLEISCNLKSEMYEINKIDIYLVIVQYNIHLQYGTEYYRIIKS